MYLLFYVFFCLDNLIFKENYPMFRVPNHRCIVTSDTENSLSYPNKDFVTPVMNQPAIVISLLQTHLVFGLWIKPARLGNE